MVMLAGGLVFLTFHVADVGSKTAGKPSIPAVPAAQEQN
jgi:hypothetical protein